MSRRASLPGAEELFRRTTERAAPAPAEEPPTPASTGRQVDEVTRPVESAPSRAPEQVQQPASTPVRASSRPRHDEKVTFYCTGQELTRLERARLTLRADHGITIDRGRIVRAALEEMLDEFESRGQSSALVRRLEDS